jgi:diaminopimelate epimerase
MLVQFSKYQGTGNDFVLLNNLDGGYDELTVSQISYLCDRRFGVGADGVIKINSSTVSSFEVDYYNPDGSKSFCGNGARCAVAFAKTLGLEVADTSFHAFDGLHSASLTVDDVSLAMSDVEEIELMDIDYLLYTGSPHYVRFVESLHHSDIVSVGKSIRYSDRFQADGVNVNLVEVTGENKLEVLTYERGVEDETLSCGTGVTAVSMSYAYKEDLMGFQTIDIKMKGGNLKVAFNHVSKGVFKEVRLIGPAKFVFLGEINV